MKKSSWEKFECAAPEELMQFYFYGPILLVWVTPNKFELEGTIQKLFFISKPRATAHPTWHCTKYCTLYTVFHTQLHTLNGIPYTTAHSTWYCLHNCTYGQESLVCISLFKFVIITIAFKKY